jgi:tetratricopeptide (TPR) repeat protein
MPAHERADAFAVMPDPGRATSLDDLIEQLRRLKVWAGNPSYEMVTDRIKKEWAAAGRPAAEIPGKNTVADCFRTGRRRLNPDLVAAIVQVLHPDPGYVTQWRQALQVIGGKVQAAAQVLVQDRLPQDLAVFTGRSAELNRLHQVFRGIQRNCPTVVISAITGMAGVGKTRLAVHFGHLLIREKRVDQVLFVNLRGFHPNPAQPSADPAAVLDGFLRLLGVPGQQIPHALNARTAAYRDRLAGSCTLVVLDNAANANQVRPLLPDTAGCPVLITSRRDLTDLHPATHLMVDVFTPAESLQYLTAAVAGVPVGDDHDAPARIAARCGHLPLALGLVVGHIRARPGWSLTDHADRLDEHHQHGRVNSDVELALDLSYRQLPVEQQRLLRLTALHPGQEFDAYAAAALADTDLDTVRAHLDQLCGSHLLQQMGPGRYTFHDLIRAYAGGRAIDDEPPPQRRAALTRLFDFYLATAATAMDILYPAESCLRPGVPPLGTPAPALVDPDTALIWLDIERPTLVTVAGHTAVHGWTTHTTRLSAILFRYLHGGYHTDAIAVHGYALSVANHTDAPAQAHALTGLGIAHGQLGCYQDAVDHLQQALQLFRQIDDLAGQARVLNSFGDVEYRQGHYQPASDHYEQALILFRQTGDPAGEALALSNLGVIKARLGRHGEAAECIHQALALHRKLGNHVSDVSTLNQLGDIETPLLGRYKMVIDHLQQALALFRQLGNRAGEAWTLDGLGIVYTDLGQPEQATRHYKQALAILRETDDRSSQAWVLNGLGEAARAAGRPTDAAAHHTAAHALATDIGDRDQQARAHIGLGHANRTLGDQACAREHYQHALDLYTELGMPGAAQIRIYLATLDDTCPDQG